MLANNKAGHRRSAPWTDHWRSWYQLERWRRPERQEARLRQLRAASRDDGDDAVALAAHHGVIAKNVAHLLDQLRATPKSQLRSRAAGSRAGRAPGWRPWEIRDGQAAQTETEQ